jgi:thiosulfate/3-mercaptopyruvate sulfurtransferase
MAQPPPVPTPLVSSEWLAQHRHDPHLVILDIRSADAGGRAAFEAGHIPGAIHSDYAKDGWRAAHGLAVGMLPSEEALSILLSTLGLTPENHVVVVPAGMSSSDFSAAARVYWTLKAAGHLPVSILDGGFAGWKADPSRPVATGLPDARARTQYPVTLDPALRADLSHVEQVVARRRGTLLDARSKSFFEGEEKSAQALRPGRLPGAVNLDQAASYDADRNRLKPREELERIFAPVPDGAVVSYCNTGHSAAMNWFVLSEILGRPDVRLYDGSMSEWTQDQARPVETGPAAR